MTVNANALALPLASGTVQTVVTSPPYYGLRDYGIDGQIGLEQTPDEYIANLVAVFREVWRVLRDDGTVFLNLGDSYAGSNKGLGADGTQYAGEKQRTNREWQIDKGKRTLPRWGGGNIPAPDGLKPKDLIGIPWMVAFALRADGWYLRSDIIWHKPNPMPESVKDRPTRAHEYVFLLTKQARYYYDAKAVMEEAAYDGRKDEVMKGSTKYRESVVPGQAEHTMAARGHVRWIKDDNGLRVRNRRSVWKIATQPTPFAHFATMPENLVEPCILAGSRAGDWVLDPFMGSGTVAKVAMRLGRKVAGVELNFRYIREIAKLRTQSVQTIMEVR